MNTTALIGQWSMDGARRDLAGRFRSSIDILGALAGRDDVTEPSAPQASVVLLKQAGEEDWRPLAVGT